MKTDRSNVLLIATANNLPRDASVRRCRSLRLVICFGALGQTQQHQGYRGVPI